MRAFEGSFVAIAAALVALGACARDSEVKPGADAAASAPSEGAGEKGKPDASSDDDEVRPVYPALGDAGTSAVAVALCQAVSERVEQRRAECCGGPAPVVLTSECVRMTSAAIASGATKVDPGAVAACRAAVDTAYAGCDWVGPFSPGLPDACKGLFAGTLEKGARCRSSLECKAGLRCQGAGPTTAGKCEGGKADGEPCGSAVDALATVARQAVDEAHPECQKACVARKCGDLVADEAPCTTTAECRSGSVCLGRSKESGALGHGTLGRTCQKRGVGKIGEACTYGAPCERGGECISGTCAVKKGNGEACASDFECRAGCVKGAGESKGKCGMRCDVR